MELPSICHFCELNLAEYSESQWFDDGHYYTNASVPSPCEEILYGELYIFSDTKRTFCSNCFQSVWDNYKILKPQSSGCGLCNNHKYLVINQYKVLDFFRDPSTAGITKICQNEKYYGYDFHANRMNVEFVHFDINQRYIKTCLDCIEQLKVSKKMEENGDTFLGF